MDVDAAAKPSKPAEDGWDYGGAAGGADMAAEGGAADGAPLWRKMHAHAARVRALTRARAQAHRRAARPP